MKIYIAHARKGGYVRDLYNPIRKSTLLQKHHIIFPHDDCDKPFDSKSFFSKECDVVIAEVSHAATGLGIELGWADICDIPIICIYKTGTKISGSLKVITNYLVPYNDSEEMILGIVQTLNNL